jgi:hypothetical protein
LKRVETTPTVDYFPAVDPKLAALEARSSKRLKPLHSIAVK